MAEITSFISSIPSLGDTTRSCEPLLEPHVQMVRCPLPPKHVLLCAKCGSTAAVLSSVSGDSREFRWSQCRWERRQQRSAGVDRPFESVREDVDRFVGILGGFVSGRIWNSGSLHVGSAASTKPSSLALCATNCTAPSSGSAGEKRGTRVGDETR